MAEMSRLAGAQTAFITAPSMLTADAVPTYLFTHGFVASGGERIDAIHATYAARVRLVARETGSVLIDAAAAFAARSDRGRSLLRADGIHLTAEGIEVMAGLVAQALLDAGVLDGVATP